MKPETWVLRWFKGPMAHEYRGDLSMLSDQKRAKRYSSKEEALDDVGEEVHFGHYGPQDVIGWKAVRLVKRAA